MIAQRRGDEKMDEWMIEGINLSKKKKIEGAD